MAFPVDPNNVTIEIWYDSTWNDITSYVYHRDASPLVIVRGRQNEGKNCDPGTLDCQLNNRSGRFSPKNPSSPLYGKIGRFTKIRVKVTYNAIVYTRFVGEIVSWPSRWDLSGKDIWVPLKAAGILRRLGQGKKPLRSAMFRAMAGVAPGDYVPHAYWPLEDGGNATQLAAYHSGGIPGTMAGDATPASEADLISSDPLPFLDAGSTAKFVVPSYTDTDVWVVQLVIKVPAEPVADVTLAEFHTTGGEIKKWRLYIQALATDVVSFVGLDATGAEISGAGVPLNGSPTAGPTEDDFYGNWAFVSLGSLNTPGSSVAGYIGITTGTDIVPGFGASVGPLTHGMISSITFYGQAATSGLAVGHLAVFIDPNIDPDEDSDTNAAAMLGWAGDLATDRFARLCTQRQIPYTVVGTTAAQMGPERTVTFLQACRDSEDLDQGFLFEQRDDLGLKLRTNSSRYNQVPVALSYDTKGLTELDPQPDDLNVANDREVKRRNGSSARRELTSGPLSVEDPPDGMGRLDDSITVDALGDDQVDNIAGWRLHVGTWDAERYPRVGIKLGANPALIPAVVPLDSGDLITISDLPSWLPPGDAELIIEGYKETIGLYDWDFTFNCSPGGPYNVVGVWGALSHELRANINTSVTSIDVVNTDLTQPMLATSGLGAGYGITVGGEEMQVTAVADSLITFGATGTASTGSSGSRTPGLPTSSADGNLILIFASTRNSGTGTVDTPTNWTRLPVFPTGANCQLFGRVYDGVWTMPTISYTSGSANEDTIAQSMRLAGKWSDPAKILIGSAQCLNTSAQNITYPGLPKPLCDHAIILYCGWKQDDYTSVAAISGATEIQEASSTAGNDASQIWDYVIQTTATAIASGAFAVTGGSTAISRGAVIALRCDYQVATVTRSTNGVSASHTAGDDVVLTRPMRWGLL